VVVVNKVDGRWTVSQSIEWPAGRPTERLEPSGAAAVSSYGIGETFY
jgi:hypothetical protein